MENTIKVHVIMDNSDHAVVDAIGKLKNIEVVQWDYGFDTAYQWTVHNESVQVDVFLSSEYAQVSILDSEGKKLQRDAALLRRIKSLYLLRPSAKFVLLCDEDRERPEKRHFLSHLVGMGIYDFRTHTQFSLENLEEYIKEPKRTIAHVQAYMPENNPQPATPIKKPEKKEELKAIDIFATMLKNRREGAEHKKKPAKVKHVIEKVRPSVITFMSLGSCNGDSALLAQTLATMLAKKEAKVALVEVAGDGVPRVGFSTNIKSSKKTFDAALQRIEDEEDISSLLINVKEALDTIPSYDGAIKGKLKNLPESLHVLAARENISPNRHAMHGIKQDTLEEAPQEIVNQLIMRHNYDAVIFVLNGNLYHKIVFQTIKVSNYIYCVFDQHPAHVSWLRQGLLALDELGVPKKNVRTVCFPWYDLANINQASIEAALDTEVDYYLPDVRKEIWNENRPKATFVLLNPSTADEVANDPTVTRCHQIRAKVGMRLINRGKHLCPEVHRSEPVVHLTGPHRPGKRQLHLRSR